MPMNDERREDAGLEPFFEAARAHPPAPSAALMAAVRAAEEPEEREAPRWRAAACGCRERRCTVFGCLGHCRSTTRTRTSEKTPTGLPALVRRGRGDLRVVFLLH